MGSNELAKWRAGKPALLVIFAQIVASMADDVAEICQTLRERRPLSAEMPAPPPLKDWLAMYRDHRRLHDFIWRMLGSSEPGEPSASETADAMREFQRTETVESLTEKLEAIPPDEFTRMMMEGQQEATAFYREHLETMEGVLTGKRDITEGVDPQLPASTEMQFLLWVWLPCWVEYREYPTRLFHRARAGRTTDADLSDLEDMLRLDKSVLADPLIARRWHETFHARNKARFQKLATAVTGRPRGNLPPRKVKEALAGLISQAAWAMKHPLTEPEIRQLFDIISRLKYQKIDTDLPLASETMSKAIQRQRNFPSLPMKSDKNRK